jgi:hypothetical protein
LVGQKEAEKYLDNSDSISVFLMSLRKAQSFTIKPDGNWIDETFNPTKLLLVLVVDHRR